jgi:hypothetical protein
MKKHDDYISGPHHFWIHFWCGLVFGAIVSTWVSCSLFESTPIILITAGPGALVIAYCCGRWGDSAWQWLLDQWPWHT